MFREIGFLCSRRNFEAIDVQQGGHLLQALSQVSQRDGRNVP